MHCNIEALQLEAHKSGVHNTSIFKCKIKHTNT